jgi:hypothetical protein
METSDPSEDQEPWYSARCLFCRESPGQHNIYEERIILIRAENEDQAIQIAEDEAEEYVAGTEGWSYTGFVDVFHLFEPTIGHRSELFSLMRSSELSESDYLDRFYDSGSEHWRRDESGES